ncbi:hypothetical protein A374_07859 [Fictibacillus macauensis ZFHKF-1]|uniref:Uncharacterized protein n=1 Tax=Fictibacillus macauensis ZFHKF-1 TaxID=1196324 RepID=I8UFX9_9BACL|nr:hypothetical protein [Fictibacillus macauensis]EIT85733.1 hypothetical protein A374_07859 [Fictibacillus macauensis ZFHKF-1]
MKSKVVMLTAVIFMMMASTVFAKAPLEVISTGEDASSSTAMFKDSYATISIKKKKGDGKVKLQLWRERVLLSDEMVGETKWVSATGVGYQKIFKLENDGDYYIRIIEDGDAKARGLGVNYKAKSLLQ